MAIKLFIYPKLAAQVSTSGLATEPKQDVMISELQDINTELDSQTTALIDVNAELDAQTILITSTNTKLDTQTTELQNINTELDSQTTLITATNTKLDTQITALNDVNTELNTQTTELQQIEAEVTSIKNKIASALFTLPYDTIQIVSKTADGPTQIVSKTGGLVGSVVQTINIVYDVDGDFESAVVS